MNIEELNKIAIATREKQSGKNQRICVCAGASCMSSGSQGVIDSTKAPATVGDFRRVPGRSHVPVVASLEEALTLGERPDALLIGIAPTGGRLPDVWRRTLLRAIEAGLDIISGLHTFLADDPELVAAAVDAGVTLHDVRRPSGDKVTAVGRAHLPGRKVVLAVGTDCAIGKMSVMLELRDAARRAGDSAAFVATGQTGIIIEGWGAPVDAVVSDFVNGTVEGIVARAEESGAPRPGDRENRFPSEITKMSPF